MRVYVSEGSRPTHTRPHLGRQQTWLFLTHVCARVQHNIKPTENGHWHHQKNHEKAKRRNFQRGKSSMMPNRCPALQAMFREHIQAQGHREAVKRLQSGGLGAKAKAKAVGCGNINPSAARTTVTQRGSEAVLRALGTLAGGWSIPPACLTGTHAAAHTHAHTHSWARVQ